MNDIGATVVLSAWGLEVLHPGDESMRERHIHKVAAQVLNGSRTRHRVARLRLARRLELRFARQRYWRRWFAL